MKNNTIKFWVVNRLVGVVALWVICFIFMSIIGNVYLNAVILFILFFGSLFYTSHLLDDGNANANERLMWQKIESMLK